MTLGAPRAPARFTSINAGSHDEAFVLMAKHDEDPFPQKVNLAPGAYKDENGRPWILPSIRKATQKMMDHPEYNHEYTGPGGNRSFALAALDLALGEEVARSGTVASIQTISGTGACHLGATFLAQFYPFPSGGDKKVYIGAPTWANHVPLFDYVGIRARLFDWIDLVTGLLNFDGLVKVLEEAEDSSVVLLQTVAHNPTGVDPTRDQWARLADIFHRKGHFAFFDNAYQGFASGDVAHDRWPLELFATNGIPMLIAQSFSKNCGLYGERIGALHVICADAQQAEIVESQLKQLVRVEVSCPPSFGAEIVNILLHDPKIRQQWKLDMQQMYDRLVAMRHGLLDRLAKLGTPGKWDAIAKGSGMFCMCPLSEAQCLALVEDHHIYIISNGRLSFTGLTEDNLDYVASCIHKVTKTIP